MRRGPKADLPAAKLARGTYQPCRDAHRIAIEAPDNTPVAPTWLTKGGRAVWQDNIDRIVAARQTSSLDSEMVANWCNLQALVRAAWDQGGLPSASHLSESRKIAEQLGLFGAKSRVGQQVPGADEARNPFVRLLAS